MPILYVAFYKLRLVDLNDPNLWMESLCFAPAGMISAYYLTRLFDRAGTMIQKTLIIIGWIVSLPISIVSSLIGGKMLPMWIGPWLFGLLPLVIGLWIANRIGRTAHLGRD